MDDWNKDSQDEYTGITAQRRIRRRADASGKAEDPGRPDVFGAPAELAEPEIPAGKPEELPESGEPETAEESEKQNEPETPEKPAEKEPAEPVVQAADSRVPPEARRMAAAPYGVPREGAKRPGTRPQVAPGRPPVPEERRPAPGRRYEAPSAEQMRSGSAQRERSAQVNVGYAPGRMSDGATRSMPAADPKREAMYGQREANLYGRDPKQETLYGRDARAYLEKRKQPFRMEEEKNPVQEKPGHKTLRAVVALLVVAGLALTGWMLWKEFLSKDRKANPDVPQILSFEAPETAGKIAPVELSFSVETGKDVGGVRLRGEGDIDLGTETSLADNADKKIWTIKMSVATGFAGKVILQVRRTGEENWIDTDRTAEINVSSPVGVDPQQVPVVTADPEDDDYYDPDAEPTDTPEPGQATPAPTEPQPTEAPKDEQATDAPAVLLTPEPTPTPTPVPEEVTPTPPLTAEAAPEADPGLITQTTVWTSNTKKEKEYSRPAKELIHMPAADEYYSEPKLGVLTFRGDNFRRNAAAGTMSAAPLKLSVLWQTEGGSARGEKQTYYGYQWTGQPVITRWSMEVRTKSNITEAKIEKYALKEVIIAGMDGAIRFLDLEDGKITRNSIKLGYAMRGTPSLHPRGRPFMAVGQYARKMKNKRGQIGLRQYNLYSQKEVKFIDGLDGKYHRPLNDVGSFETSALIDRESDTLIAIGTNGMLYLESLGTTFDYNLGVMTLSPSIVTMNSLAKGQSRGKQKASPLVAVESSPAAYDRYVWYADMGGVLRCVDTNNLKPVWAVDTGDSVMAAIAMDLTENRELNLYTANMLNNRKKGNSNIQIRRYDALSGSEAWCTEVGVYKGKKDNTKDNVGAKASPVIGQNKLNDYVYFTVTGLSEEGAGQLGLKSDTPAALIALEKKNGRVAWTYGLGSRSESSPIALYDKQGNGWILQCEQNGKIHLLDGLTGSEISSLQVEGEIEASPAAYNNVVVIGTTGKGKAFIYGIEVKLDKPQEEGTGTPTPAPATEAPPEEDDESEGDGREDYAEYDEYDEYEDYDIDGEEGDA
ncbi:MAG: hypothetical protein IKE15_01285 [Clostridia bacterium]|nr:hypothetical protein [Clostridia bacterium]